MVHTGQSLAGGEQSLPVITDAATGFGNFRFKMGTSTWTYNYYPDSPWLRTTDRFAFVPLTAIQRGAEGETIANGLCDHLTQSLQTTRYNHAKFLFSYSGQGGRYLRELDKLHDDARDTRAGARQSKGGYYNTAIDDVKQAKKICDAAGLSYTVAAITWMQGERGNDFRINRWDSMLSRTAFLDIYKNDLVQLKNDYVSDVRKITGHKSLPHFFTYQTNGAMSGTAQMMACDQEKDMHLVSPTYMLPSAVNSHFDIGGKPAHGAAVHITADGERMLGELFGKVIRKVMVENKKWQPLRPLSAVYDKIENAVIVSFHVPVPPLVIDTSFLPRQGSGAGFEVYDADNKLYAIKDILVAGRDRIKLLLTDKMIQAKSCFVRYGLSSFVKNIDQPVLDVYPGEDSSTGKIAFQGNMLSQFIVLNKEGAFYLYSLQVNGQRADALVVRSAYLDERGNTILNVEKDGPRSGIYFAKNRKCFVSRIFAYGNIRDSDREKSTFAFSDTAYGHRAGEPYPLYNWSVVFQDLPVQSMKK